MRVGVYTPYLDTLGGGERYILTIAEYLSRAHSVDVLLDDQLPHCTAEQWIAKIRDRLNLHLTLVRFKSGCIEKRALQSETRELFSEYDAFFYMTDGTMFPCGAANAFVLIQKPRMRWSGRDAHSSCLRHDLLETWSTVICNSVFTKTLVDREWDVNARVIYPPVDTASLEPLEKRRFILSVGRFFTGDHCKKQHILVQVYRELVDSGLGGWHLCLVGGVREKGRPYLSWIRELAKGLPVAILPNAHSSTLRRLYGHASLYWHAAGFGEDPARHPDRLEHFGIAPVEAMAAGCVPIVYRGGGLTETVTHRQTGFLWSRLIDLKSYTMQLVRDERLRAHVGRHGTAGSRRFDKLRFCNEVDALLSPANAR